MDTKILIVDDSKTDLMLISGMLSEFTVLTARDGFEAMQVINENLDIDLIILDLNMPDMNGFQVLSALKSDSKFSKMRTIILTNYDEIGNEIKGLEMGAVDYIRKPVNIESLKIRIGIHLKLTRIQKKIEQDNEMLEEIVSMRTNELVEARNITIHALLGLLEVRNIESRNHTLRTQKIMEALCRHLRTKAKYRDILTDEYITEIVATTPLHDLGKVGVPDSILLKPGKLTKDEFEIMKNHVKFGAEALEKELDSSMEVPGFIKSAVEIIETHHEKFDGTGYPHGLAGKDIPLSGRLMAVIDVYDSLISKRIYKPSFTNRFALEMINEESGKHFDPDIVTCFLEIGDEISEITYSLLPEGIQEEA